MIQSLVLLLPCRPRHLCPESGLSVPAWSFLPRCLPTLLPVGPPRLHTAVRVLVSPGVRWKLSVFFMEVDVHVHSPQGISLCSQLKVGVALISN